MPIKQTRNAVLKNKACFPKIFLNLIQQLFCYVYNFSEMCLHSEIGVTKSPDKKRNSHTLMIWLFRLDGCQASVTTVSQVRGQGKPVRSPRRLSHACHRLPPHRIPAVYFRGYETIIHYQVTKFIFDSSLLGSVPRHGRNYQY